MPPVLGGAAPEQVRFFPLFLRFSIGKCRNCPFFRAFQQEMKEKTGQQVHDYAKLGADLDAAMAASTPAN